MKGRRGNIHPTPEKYCAFCGKKMERQIYPSKLEDLGAFKRRKYCSRECMKKAFVVKDASEQTWSGAHESARKIVYLIEEREKKCEICGSTKNVDIHHKDFNHQNNNSDNLMLVCRSCHLKIHNPKSVCKICGKPAASHGYCQMHLKRWKKYRNPLYYQGRIVDTEFNGRADQKQVIGIIQETKGGEFVAQYNSIKEASEKTGVNAAAICNVCAGRRFTTRGYRWRKLLKE